MTTLSACTSSAIGTTMNEDMRLAARTLVVWVEMTTAPLTMTVACTVVRATIWMNSSSGGTQRRLMYRPMRYTAMPR